MDEREEKPRTWYQGCRLGSRKVEEVAARSKVFFGGNPWEVLGHLGTSRMSFWNCLDSKHGTQFH